MNTASRQTRGNGTNLCESPTCDDDQRGKGTTELNYKTLGKGGTREHIKGEHGSGKAELPQVSVA